MSGSVLAVVANYDFSDNADALKAGLAPHFQTLLIDNSSPTPPRLADLVLPNRHYTGLWNEAVRLARERGSDWLFFVASDVQIPDPTGLATGIRRTLRKSSVGIYTPSLLEGSRAYFTACVRRTPGGLRECFIVEGFCFLARTSILSQVYPVDFAANAYGWGIDVVTAFHAHRMGYQVLVDDRIGIYHPASSHSIPTDIAQEQQIGFYGQDVVQFQEWALERLRCEGQPGELARRWARQVSRLFLRAGIMIPGRRMAPTQSL